MLVSGPRLGAARARNTNVCGGGHLVPEHDAVDILGVPAAPLHPAGLRGVLGAEHRGVVHGRRAVPHLVVVFLWVRFGLLLSGVCSWLGCGIFFFARAPVL